MDQKGNIHVEYLCGQPSWKFSRKNDEEYCKVCKHGIHDLKNKSPREIELLLNSGTAICGSFYRDQFMIDVRTQRSPATFKLVIAGLITWFSATRLSAQVQGQQVQVEQHYLGSDSSARAQDSAAIASETVPPVCSTEAAAMVSKHKKMYHRIGNSRWYFTRRFPFIVRKRAFRGKIRYKP
jgi:hypothetical protein